MVALAGAADPAPPAEAADPVAAAASSHETGVRADQQVFDLALRGLNARFRDAMARLLEDARSRGDLDETLAATDLWERMGRLTNVTVFGAHAPLQGVRVCPMPPAPASAGLVGQAFTSYVSKVVTLAGHYNAAASNRQTRYLGILDDLMREQTRRGALDDAVSVRDQRAEAEQAGASRVIVPGAPRPRPPSPAPVAPPVPAPALVRPGGFQWEGTVWDWYRGREDQPLIRITLRPNGRIDGARSLSRWEVGRDGRLLIHRDDGEPRELVLDRSKREARSTDGERTMKLVEK